MGDGPCNRQGSLQTSAGEQGWGNPHPSKRRQRKEFEAHAGPSHCQVLVNHWTPILTGHFQDRSTRPPPGIAGKPELESMDNTEEDPQPLESRYSPKRFEAAFCLWYRNLSPHCQGDLFTYGPPNFDPTYEEDTRTVNYIARGVMEHLKYELGLKCFFTVKGLRGHANKSCVGTLPSNSVASAQCANCKKVFKGAGFLKRHLLKCGPQPCPHCSHVSTCHRKLLRHVTRMHPTLL